MPPYVSRKRDHSPDTSLPAKQKTPSKVAANRSKPTLFEAADAPKKNTKSAAETQKYLDSLPGNDDDSSTSELDSDEFEDVPPAKKRKTNGEAKGHDKEEDDEDSDDDEMDWEDAIGSEPANPSASTAQDDQEIGDVSISINQDGTYEEPLVSLATGKKGPSKKERQARMLTHCLHVQSLMWHNTVRNSWLNDKELQKVLVDGLPDGVKREITRWRESMGTLTKEELDAKKKQAAAKQKGKKGRKGKDKSSGRDWAYDAQHLEQGVPDLSRGDPLLRLLKVVTAYWRKRFIVTAPAFRKLGFMPLKRLRDEIKGWEKNRNDFDEYGERVENVQALRDLARKCEGSRDVGAQLFVALLRGIGLETRMVSNLQPAGFGFSKSEEADAKKPKKAAKSTESKIEVESDIEEKSNKKRAAGKKAKSAEDEKPSRKSSRGNKGDPISLDDSESPLSEPPSDDDADVDDDDDLSVVDITPAARKRPTKKYDRDLAFPTYWAEVCSPATHKYIPVDPIVLATIGSTEELLQSLEPRGKRAENAKQVICYVTGYSADGSAKDVTVRYLKRHQLPGKTKGMRVSAEKIPIYNKRGKVKKYEEYDWFRTVMSLYDRPEAKRTAADDLEEQTDLKPFKPGKEGKEVEKESLQWYKQSAEYVLEQHLRREEALLPGSEPVKTFTAGKGDKAKEHPVFRREDVVICKTVESWHKEGRAIKTGEQPMKHVPMRAVTLIKKREMEDAQRETGQKLQQGLYSRNQTDWIIPPPIENGVIPKNAYGNMDVYVDTMVPRGAVHLPLKGSAKLCRKLEIDYAEACTGFEFGKQRAVPVLTGVVVAKENAQMVRDAWRAEQAELKRKEDTKRTGIALHWWRKMLMSLRIIERMKAEYDTHEGEDEINPFVSKAKREGRDTAQMKMEDDTGAGGFFPPGHDEEEVPQHKPNGDVHNEDEHMGGGFLAEGEDEERTPYTADGGFLVEENGDDTAAPETSTAQTSVTPVSLQSMHKAPNLPSDDEEMDDVRNDNADDGDNVDEDEDMLDAEVEPPKPKEPTKRQPQKKAASKAVKSVASRLNRRAKKIAPPLSEDNQASEEEDELDSDEPVKATKRTSIKATPKSNRQSSGRVSKKATPVRSQYFTSADIDNEDKEEEEDEEDESSEPEVVKPTRTTARTRRNA